MYRFSCIVQSCTQSCSATFILLHQQEISPCYLFPFATMLYMPFELDVIQYTYNTHRYCQLCSTVEAIRKYVKHTTTVPAQKYRLWRPMSRTFPSSLKPLTWEATRDMKLCTHNKHNSRLWEGSRREHMYTASIDPVYKRVPAYCLEKRRTETR